MNKAVGPMGLQLRFHTEGLRLPGLSQVWELIKLTKFLRAEKIAEIGDYAHGRLDHNIFSYSR